MIEHEEKSSHKRWMLLFLVIGAVLVRGVQQGWFL